MSSQPFEILSQSGPHIFFKPPEKVKINESVIALYMTNQKIEILIEELKEKGPLVGFGEFGPNAYATPPSKLEPQGYDFEIYTWQSGAVRASNPKSNFIVILGAQKIKKFEYVYFILSQDPPIQNGFLEKTYQASKTDTKIYAISHQTFRSFLAELYLPGWL